MVGSGVGQLFRRSRVKSTPARANLDMRTMTMGDTTLWLDSLQSMRGHKWNPHGVGDREVGFNDPEYKGWRLCFCRANVIVSFTFFHTNSDIAGQYVRIVDGRIKHYLDTH